MIAWHVTTIKKLNRYQSIGYIIPPVRAWGKIEDAVSFSNQTGRRIIVRLKLPDNLPILGGHKGKAVVYNARYSLGNY